MATPLLRGTPDAFAKKTQDALKQARSDIRDSVSKVLKPRNKKDSSSESSSKDSSDSGADKDTAKSDTSSDKSDKSSSKSGDE